MIGKKIHNYKFISILGEGGMAVVYKAYDENLDRYVAIKVINSKYLNDLVFVERFKQEAKNQANLAHQNIVTVFGFLEHTDVLGIVMEYIEGLTVDQLIERNKRLSVNQSLQIIDQILAGINYAHENGFIHRDLKPSNLIIDKKGIAKIMDFGISLSSLNTKKILPDNKYLGTILYMSPEQIQGKTSTVKSDLYSLGLTLFEMLAGTPAYSFGSEKEVINAHLKGIPLRLSKIDAEIPGKIDEIILSAMNKSRSNNFDDAKDFKEAVEKLISELPFVNEDQLGIKPLTLKHKRFDRKGIMIPVLAFVLLAAIITLSYLLVNKFLLADSLDYQNENEITNTHNYSSNPAYIFPSSWEELKTGTKENLNSILFINNSNGIVAGDNGAILITTDGGKFWKALKLNTSNNLNDLILYKDRLLAVGDNGMIFYSIDYGHNWKKILSPINKNFYGLDFKENTLLLCGSDGAILKSDDDGLSFRKVNSNTSELLFDIAFVDSKRALAVGWNGIMLLSSDRGETWQKLSTITTNYLRRLHFVNQFLGYTIGGEGTLLKTIDGGENWELEELNMASGLSDILFKDEKIGCIITNDGKFLYTETSGEKWIDKQINKHLPIKSFTILSNGNIIVTGLNGMLLKNKL